MAGTRPRPVPEFKDIDHYRTPLSPLCITEGTHEIVRPKPRRPGGRLVERPYVLYQTTSSSPVKPQPVEHATTSVATQRTILHNNCSSFVQNINSTTPTQQQQQQQQINTKCLSLSQEETKKFEEYEEIKQNVISPRRSMNKSLPDNFSPGPQLVPERDVNTVPVKNFDIFSPKLQEDVKKLKPDESKERNMTTDYGMIRKETNDKVTIVVENAPQHQPSLIVKPLNVTGRVPGQQQNVSRHNRQSKSPKNNLKSNSWSADINVQVKLEDNSKSKNQSAGNLVVQKQQQQQLLQQQQRCNNNKSGSSATTRTEQQHATTNNNSRTARLSHRHVSVEELRSLQRRQEAGSSSDETRSSGHASMSDTLSSSPGITERHQHYRSPLNSVPEDDRLSASVMPNQLCGQQTTATANKTNRKSQANRSRHRATPAKLVPAGSGLEDIKLAIQQLTLKSGGYSTSTYSSQSGSESSEPAVRRLIRHSSLETINTNVTTADEFLWVDSHNRLVEVQQLPWSHHCVYRVLTSGRTKDICQRVSMETIPRLSYLLQRALVRITREAQRLSKNMGICFKQQVSSAIRINLSPSLADSCTKACLRSAAMFAVSGDHVRQSKSSRAGLQLSVGRFQRWMADVRVAKFIHEYAAVYLTAGIENLLEELVIQTMPPDNETMLTATILEHAIANNGDLWGLLQPYAHLNAGRVASGALAMPHWDSVSSVNTESTHTSKNSSKSLEQSLVTTCVGSTGQLRELINRITTLQLNRQVITWSLTAINTLFYFMRCSQLEHGEHQVQELVYERTYVVLPPLVEWVRVSSAHAEHRHSIVIDQDDIMQAARLLLPGVDCPVRPLCLDEGGYESDCARKVKTEAAFKLLTSGRAELIPHGVSLLPSTKINSVNEVGLTALMLACCNNDLTAVRCLLDAGADTGVETPSQPHVETQYWTALCYTAVQGNLPIARLLLERGAYVEGGAKPSEDRCTMTPLQLSAAVGNTDMVTLLLAHGANACMSTLLTDPLCYSVSAQRGSCCALAVAAAHGQRTTLHKLLSHPLSPHTKEVLSLEEILAEGSTQERPSVSHKTQMKALQEAMYHSAESGHLDVTLDLRQLGVAWTLHCWMTSLSTATDLHLDSVMDTLLQDFLSAWPEDHSTLFVDECLPLLFNIFRYTKKEGTTLLLADIFSTCYGWEEMNPIETSFTTTTARIDPTFVNNPELSDVQFRVEGKVLYAHKIVLITASARFKNMLNTKLCDGTPPIIQINDIRYHIFQLVMQYLYEGGTASLEVSNTDVLELMTAANFFQLDGLLKYTESRAAKMVDLDNIVSMYIHAKVYNAGQLLEHCQGFLLQNMVALLTYDDSVKRLLFGKKIHSHDVLAGLMTTLQNRIKTKTNTSVSRNKPNN